MEHTNKKSFSILKWIIFPLLVLAFGIGIIYVSVRIFAWSGTIPSLLLVLVCLTISLIFVLHTSNHKNKSAKTAAFIFEAGGVAALGITLVFSIVVLRQFSGAMQTIDKQTSVDLEKQKETTKQISELKQIKSRSAQATLAKSVATDTVEKKEELTTAKVFELAEQLLFWPLVGETAWYLIGLMAVFGLVIFEEPKNEIEEMPLRTRASFNSLPQQAPLRTRTPRQTIYKETPKQFVNRSNPVESYTLHWQNSGWRVYDASSTYIGHISNRKFDKFNPITYDAIGELL